MGAISRFLSTASRVGRSRYTSRPSTRGMVGVRVPTGRPAIPAYNGDPTSHVLVENVFLAKKVLLANVEECGVSLPIRNATCVLQERNNVPKYPFLADPYHICHGRSEPPVTCGLGELDVTYSFDGRTFAHTRAE